MKFKQKYSIESNEMYDHHFRLKKRCEQDWKNIGYAVKCISENVKNFPNVLRKTSVKIDNVNDNNIKPNTENENIKPK